MDIGSKIAKIRREKNIKQTYVAHRLNKTTAWLCNLEKGKRGINTQTLCDIARVLDVDVASFFAK